VNHEPTSIRYIFSIRRPQIAYLPPVIKQKNNKLLMSDTKQATPLTLKDLQAAVHGSAAAFRCRRSLQPAGKPGDKVFPPTYVGGTYAVEFRRWPGRTEPVPCVLMDSVQSQANRMEQALHEAGSELGLPLVEVDFTDCAPTGDEAKDKEPGRLRDAVGKLSVLQLPHRLADAILRDSEVKEGGGSSEKKVPFRESRQGKAVTDATTSKATALYRLCPTALLFGMWDSTGPKGGLGAKFERAMVSEVVGIGAEFGVKTASRIDPLISKTAGVILYEAKDSSRVWTLDPSLAKLKDGKPIPLGSKVKDGKLVMGDGKVSEANLGNVTPSFSKYSKGAEGLDPMKYRSASVEHTVHGNESEFSVRMRASGEAPQARQEQIAPGGVTLEYAEQITTLSLICLRRLQLPVKDKDSKATSDAGRAVLAALGLCAAALAFENGMGLRSRCLLWPETAMEWELLEKPGEKEPKKFAITGNEAKALLKAAIKAAKDAGLEFEESLTLKPSDDLKKLVRKSQDLAIKEVGGEGE
jgi:CRISPR-associated protein Csb1